MSMTLKNELNTLLNNLANTNGKHEASSLLEHFATLLIEYCENERNIIRVYRLLKQLEGELRFTDSHTLSSIKWIVEKLLFLIKSEEEIIEFRINHPDFVENKSLRNTDLSSLIWTDEKISLVELIYGISKSLNNGKASIKSIAESFENMFHVELGSYYRILLDINNRKSNTTRYLDTLPENLIDALEKLNR